MAMGACVRCCFALSASQSSLYDVLQVSKTATALEIKAAYRKQALQYHPDVNSNPDAENQFIELSKAYEVLSDKHTRAAYDQHGVGALKGWVSKGVTDIWSSWDEFKPTQRKTRRASARAYSGATKESSEHRTRLGEGSDPLGEEAQLGDVVEYFLSNASKAQHQDGRLKGVGLVVGRNIDRQDKDKLPLECLDLVEIEPLYKEEEDSNEWRSDPMEGPAFASLPTLRILNASYRRVEDIWTISDQLSAHCGTPVYAEEIVF